MDCALPQVFQHEAKRACCVSHGIRSMQNNEGIKILIVTLDILCYTYPVLRRPMISDKFNHTLNNALHYLPLSCCRSPIVAHILKSNTYIEFLVYLK